MRIVISIMEATAQVTSATVQQGASSFMAGNNKPVIVTCLLAILSFFMLFTNAILNWIQQLSTDETVWDKMFNNLSLLQQHM